MNKIVTIKQGMLRVSAKMPELKATIKYLGAVTKVAKKVVPMASYRMAIRLKMRVGRRIDDLGHYSSPNHNTKAPLRSYLQFKKLSSGKLSPYEVKMREGSSKDDKYLAASVEFGTEEHPQPRPSWGKGRSILHKGSQPRYYFRKGYYDFVHKNDHGKIADKFAQEIVDGKSGDLIRKTVNVSAGMRG